MKRIVSLLGVCFFILTPVGAQDEVFNSALSLAEKYYLINNDSVLFYSQIAINIGTENGYSKTSDAYFYNAVGLFYQARYDEGIQIASLGLEWTNTHDQINSDIQGKLHYRMAANYTMKGLYEVGLEQLLKAKDIFDLTENRELSFMNLNGIGVIWLKLKEYDKALEIYEELYAYQQKDPHLAVPVCYNLANIHNELENYRKANKYINEALEIIPPDDQRLSQIYYMKGNILVGLQNYEESKKAFKSSIDLYKAQNNELNSVQPKLGLARLLVKTGNLELASIQANESLKIASKYQSLPDRTEAMGVLSLIAEKFNDLELAFNYYKIFIKLSDSLYNSAVQQQVNNQFLEQDYEKQKQQILFTQQENQLRIEAQILRQRIIIASTSVILFLGFLILLIQRNKAKERLLNNKMLIKKNKIIEEKARKLDEANSIKNRLFSIIAHDLRNPLSSLQGVIQLIEMNSASKEDLDKLLPYLTKKFEHTSILLVNLLEWSMSQMKGYNIIPNTFDLTKVIKDRYEIVRSRVETKRIIIDLPNKPFLVFAEKNMIGIVILNLLSNSIKFTPNDGKIVISIKNSTDEIIFKISDTGKGIPNDRLPYLLDEQFETTEGTHGEEGTGLGLIICKEFIHKNNGKIWIESIEGTGTTVSFSLPVSKTGTIS